MSTGFRQLLLLVSRGLIGLCRFLFRIFGLSRSHSSIVVFGVISDKKISIT